MRLSKHNRSKKGRVAPMSDDDGDNNDNESSNSHQPRQESRGVSFSTPRGKIWLILVINLCIVTTFIFMSSSRIPPLSVDSVLSDALEQDPFPKIVDETHALSATHSEATKAPQVQESSRPGGYTKLTSTSSHGKDEQLLNDRDATAAEKEKPSVISNDGTGTDADTDGELPRGRESENEAEDSFPSVKEPQQTEELLQVEPANAANEDPTPADKSDVTPAPKFNPLVNSLESTAPGGSDPAKAQQWTRTVEEKVDYIRNFSLDQDPVPKTVDQTHALSAHSETTEAPQVQEPSRPGGYTKLTSTTAPGEEEQHLNDRGGTTEAETEKPSVISNEDTGTDADTQGELPRDRESEKEAVVSFPSVTQETASDVSSAPPTTSDDTSAKADTKTPRPGQRSQTEIADLISHMKELETLAPELDDPVEKLPTDAPAAADAANTDGTLLAEDNPAIPEVELQQATEEPQQTEELLQVEAANAVTPDPTPADESDVTPAPKFDPLVNIFEWTAPGGSDPAKAQQWTRTVKEKVDYIRNFQLGGAVLRELIRQHKDELVEMREQLFG